MLSSCVLQLSVAPWRSGGRAALFAVFAFEVTNQAGQHLADFFVAAVQRYALAFADVVALLSDDELSSDLSSRTPRAIAVLCEMTIGRLFEPLGDRRGAAFRRGPQLVFQPQVAIETGTPNDRRNLSRRRNRLLVHQQVVRCLGMHDESESRPYAAQPPPCTQSPTTYNSRPTIDD